MYLATDLDREGEAIAWHVAEAANVPEDKQQRVTFGEITEPAIRDAFEHPRDIDMHLVDAQQTRRIVDRLVGYTLSPLLSRKVRGGLSAGRVQSVAVRLVVEREREIARLRGARVLDAGGAPARRRRARPSRPRSRASTADPGPGRRGRREGGLDPRRGHRPGTRRRHPRRAAGRRKGRRPPVNAKDPAPPFTTSTLQQEASRKLGFSPKRTMSVAQRLYEGIELDGEPTGLITYMRTDSTQHGRRAPWVRRAASSPSATGSSTRCPRAARPQDQVEGRPGGARGHPPDQLRARPRLARGSAEPETSCASTGSSGSAPSRPRWRRSAWRRPPSTWSAGRYGLRASATRTLFDGFSRVYTEGRDDERGRGGGALAAGRWPRATSRTSSDVTPATSTSPSRRRASPRRRSSRPSRSTASAGPPRTRRRSRRSSTAATSRSRSVGCDPELVAEHRHGPARGALRRVRRRRVHGAHGGASSTRSRAASASGCRCCASSTARFKELVDEKRQDAEARATSRPRRPTRSAREGHPMVIRLGRNGRFLACSLYPEHKESRPLPGEEPEAPHGRGRGRGVPQVR